MALPIKTFSRYLIILFLLTGSKSYSAEIIPLFGLRGGGKVIDQLANKNHNVASSNISGLILGKPYEFGKTLEIYYSHQSSDIKTINVATALNATNNVTLPVSVHYLHFGGTAPISDKKEFKTFASGGLGFTYMSPDLIGLDSELRASISIGIGIKWPVSENIAFRVESRVLATMFNNNASIFCSGGCNLTVNGSIFTQGEVFAGLSLSF